MKMFDIDDEKKLASVYGKRMGDVIDGEQLADQFKGYVFKCVAPAARRGLEGGYADNPRSPPPPAPAFPVRGAGSRAATTSRASPWWRA
jgi:hypothetical protein